MVFENIPMLFIEKVVADFKDFAGAGQSNIAGMSLYISKGLSAANSLYHFREHLPEALRRSRKELTSICPDFDLLGYVVDATKHGQIDRRNPPIARADQIYELIEITEYEDEAGTYQVARKRVVVELNDGTKRTLDEILTNVVNMWIDFLAENDIIDRIKYFPLEDEDFVPPRDSGGEAARLDIAVHPAIGVNIRCQFRRFNYELGKSEPVDLSRKSA